MFINSVSSKIRTTITATTRMKWMKKNFQHALFHGSWYLLYATPWHISKHYFRFLWGKWEAKNIDFIRMVFFFSCVQLWLKTGEVAAISSSIKWNAFWLVDVHAKQEVITLSLKDIIFLCASYFLPLFGWKTMKMENVNFYDGMLPAACCRFNIIFSSTLFLEKITS